MTVIFKPSAREDLLTVRRWGVQRWGTAAAIDFLSGLADMIDRLDRRPVIGMPRDILAPGLKSVRYKGYLIFHVYRGNDVVVIAILHERTDLAGLDFAERLAER